MSTTAGTSAADLDQAVPRIRPAAEHDSDAVFGLLEQLAHSYLPERASFDAAYPEILASPDDLFLVAVDRDDVAIGYALSSVVRLFYTNGTSAQLHELVVDERHRGRRIGTALVGRTEQECRSRGVRQLTVASLRAAGFYEALDYRSTADFLKKTFDA